MEKEKMLLKSEIIETVNSLPNEIDIDSLLEKLVVLNRIKMADEQIKNNELLSEEEVEKESNSWFE